MSTNLFNFTHDRG